MGSFLLSAKQSGALQDFFDTDYNPDFYFLSLLGERYFKKIGRSSVLKPLIKMKKHQVKFAGFDN